MNCVANIVHPYLLQIASAQYLCFYLYIKLLLHSCFDSLCSFVVARRQSALLYDVSPIVSMYFSCIYNVVLQDNGASN